MRKLLHTLLLFLIPLLSFSQEPWNETGWLPEKENHLVYDFYGILDDEQKQNLESRLTAFNDSTSNQIAIIITPAFGGNDISSFAFDVGEKWGIGQKELANGVLIVVKPKDETDGEVEIATGMGLEGALPDIFCKRIIENEMIPHFRDSDYYGGIVAALDIIEPVCAGEYSFEQYKDDSGGSAWPMLITVLVIIIIVIVCVSLDDGRNAGDGGSYSGGTFYGGNTRMNNWGGGWSGGGFSGGSHGGFGGFGGGSFGGGGASGRW